MPRLTKRQRPCKMFLFNNLAASPEWRNWQTRWTQNPVVLSTVWVRPPPPGPSARFAFETSKTMAVEEVRARDSARPDLVLCDVATHIYMGCRSFDPSMLRFCGGVCL